MVTLQILVLSFLVRIQVAQLKRLSFEGRFFCFLHCGERCSFEHIAVLGECHDASISTHPASHGTSPLSPLHPTSSIVVPPDSHFVLVEPI